MKKFTKGETILLSVIAGYLVFGLLTIGVYAKETGALSGFGGGSRETAETVEEPEPVTETVSVAEPEPTPEPEPVVESKPEPEPEPEPEVKEEEKEEEPEEEEEEIDTTGMRAGPFYKYTIMEMPFSALNVHSTQREDVDEIITHVRTGETGYVVEVTDMRVLVEVNGVFGYVAENYVELTEIPDNEYPVSLRKLTAETAVAGSTWDEYEKYAPPAATIEPSNSLTTVQPATSSELTENGDGLKVDSTEGIKNEETRE